MYRNLILACACVILVGSGVVHGLWTDRWTEPADLTDASARLEQLPTTIGAWNGTIVEMEKEGNTGMAGMIARRYVHAASGKVVTILLGCGRSGPVCTHTPEVCYAGSGYEVEKPRRFHLPTKADVQPEFWTSRFVKERTTGKTHLRIFWSWHGAEGWKVADNPRLSFAGEKLLYKLYVIREMVQRDEPLEGDACVEFMQAMLPVFQQSILTDAK